jgi:hypothetical protein
MVKRVTDAGTFRFQQRLVYIANALVNQHIGLEETDDGVWAIYFNTVSSRRSTSATSSSAG